MIDKKRVLILWSGGIDSTSVLKMYLEKTDYEIIAFKIEYKTLSSSKKRIEKEINAINKLFPELLKIREFTLKKMLVAIPHGVPGVDVMNFGNLCIYPAAGMQCDEIIIGFVNDVRKNQKDYIANKLVNLNIISTILYEKNKKIWKKRPIFVSPKFLNSKKKYIENLGELVNHCWFCREVEAAGTSNGCGTCHTCIHVKKSMIELIEL